MEITYTLIRGRRKTISLRILDDASICVRAPRHISKKEIDSFVNSHLEWIQRKRVDVIRKQSIFEKSESEDLAAKTMAQVMPFIEKYSAAMGRSPSSVKITCAKKRFGSCSSGGGICFSKYLSLYPPEAIEYVVVHELAHLFEMNHSKRFYNIVDTYLPDWKERKVLLKL